jgi:perosamine synthetase
MARDAPPLALAALTPDDAQDLADFFARNDDAETVAGFHPFPLTAHVAGELTTSPGLDRFYCARVDGRIAAFSMLRGWNEGYEVPSFGILVDAGLRGRRIGRDVTVRTLDAASELGCGRVRLTVEPGNGRARRLYRSVGFTERDERVMDLELPRRIPVSSPDLSGNESRYVQDCLESTWISSLGSYIERFEAGFAELCAVPHGVATCNGTAALHLALLAAGVGPGDEVVVPAMTYVACANAVTYCGATPVLADVTPGTWTLDPGSCAAVMSPRTRAVMAVHLYGHPADMDALRAVADAHDAAVVEDAAEAHGSRYRGRPVGSLGDVAAFSFFGNKILTTGEGGMVTTADAAAAQRVRLLRGQGQDPARRYWHVVRGFNYRMTNVAAAIGVAQLERVQTLVARRDDVAAWYREELEGLAGVRLQREEPWARRANWLTGAVLEDPAMDRDGVMRRLEDRGIETRPFFPALHHLPAYRELAEPGALPVSELLADTGLCLPTSSVMTRADVARVAAELRRALGGAA